jgi:EAL domain-containing protein (putative c-di-GMP-specific phosphodiesterase class I)
MRDKILYLDLGAIPIFVIIWYTTIFRKMTKGRSNVLFLWVTALAFFTVVSDLLAGVFMSERPLDEASQKIVIVTEYLYFILRNGTNMLYFFFMFAITRTWYRINALWKKILFLLPYIGVLAMLALNEGTHAVFTVSAEEGYMRGNYILLLYVFAAFYLIAGMACLISCRRALDLGALLALSAMYVLNIVAVVIQLLYSEMLIECYFTSISLLFIVLFVQRPEKQVDLSTGLPGYQGFREEMGKIKAAGQNIQIIVVSILNAYDISRYMGEEAYVGYIHAIEAEIRTYAKKDRLSCELYYEQPGNFYVILEDTKYNPVQAIPEIRENLQSYLGEAAKAGIRADARIVTIQFPKDISDVDELLNFGHDFTRFADVDRLYSHADKIIAQKDYQIETHFREILDRAMNTDSFSLSYQPIWSTRQKKYIAADTMMELTDEQYGTLDMTVIMGTAEKKGLSIRLGNYLMERVFMDIREKKLAEYEYVHVPLSTVQCMQLDFTDKVWKLREKYGIHPEQVCFSFKESVYENISEVLNENLNRLSAQGYRLMLDGFGKGYSNLERVLEFPLMAVRLDKSLILSSVDQEKRFIIKGIINMLSEARLTVIAQGVDDDHTMQMLVDMGCELIQGDYN